MVPPANGRYLLEWSIMEQMHTLPDAAKRAVVAGAVAAEAYRIADATLVERVKGGAANG